MYYGQKQVISQQVEDIKSLNIQIARRDEEIISLKTKLSMAITHAAQQIPEDESLTVVFPPIAEISEVKLNSGVLSFNIVNIKANNEAVTGFFFAVFNDKGVYECYPPEEIKDGIPADPTQGQAFTIKNYKPMSIKTPETMKTWESVRFFIFDAQKNLRVAMLMKLEELQ